MYSSLDDAEMLKGSIRRPKQPPAEADAKSSVELVNLFKRLIPFFKRSVRLVKSFI